MAFFLYLNLQFIRNYNFYEFSNSALFLLPQQHLLINLPVFTWLCPESPGRVYRGLGTDTAGKTGCVGILSLGSAVYCLLTPWGKDLKIPKASDNDLNADKSTSSVYVPGLFFFLSDLEIC